MKILLIAPTFTENANTMYFPIGIAYLSSYLKSKGYDIDGLNMNNYGLEKSLKLLDKKLKQNYYDVIGIGAILIAFAQIENLTNYIRAKSKSIIVLGGGVTSCETELTIKTIKPDYMVIGEGEIIFEKLLQHIQDNTKPIPKGVWEYKNGKIRHANSEAYNIGKLDELPFPDYKLMGIDKFIQLQDNSNWSHHRADIAVRKSIPISASRSCPFKCTFCHHAGMSTYRQHSVEYAKRFINKLVKKYSFTHLSIYDELFSLNKKRVLDFCEILAPLNKTFTCQLRVDQIDNEMLLSMKKAGCTEISYGIESGSQVILDSMNKKIKVEQIEKALRLTKEVGIGIQGNFLYGDPAETEKTIQETIEFQKKNKLYFIDYSMVIPYPGTDLHNLALQKGMIKDRVKFIKNVANSSKYLWNKPINLTNFTDKEYITRYNNLKELNDENHRKIQGKILQSKIIDKYTSSMIIECPNCKEVTQYDRFKFPLNTKSTIFKDRESFFGFLGINLVCPLCRSKHHIIPKNIPHVNKQFIEFENKLEYFINHNNKNIVVMPAIDRYYMAIKEDTKLFDIDIHAVLDSREYRIGDKFLCKTIEKLDKKSLNKYSDCKYIIYPWVEYKNTYKFLLQFGINKENIFSWSML